MEVVSFAGSGYLKPGVARTRSLPPPELAAELTLQLAATRSELIRNTKDAFARVGRIDPEPLRWMRPEPPVEVGEAVSVRGCVRGAFCRGLLFVLCGRLNLC